MERELHLHRRLRDLPLLAYCIDLERHFPFQPQSRRKDAAVSEEQLIHLPSLVPKFAFPVYPVDPTPDERVIPYPASPKWNHVGFQSVMSGIALPNIALPVTFSEHTEMTNELSGPMEEHALSADPAGSGRSVVEGYTGVERSLKAWESSMISLYNTNEDALLDSVLYMPPNVHSNHFTVIPERYTLTSSFSLSFSVSKSSDVSESAKSKRNRKRQRENGDQDERPAPGSIGTYLNQRMQKPLAWSRKEDEILTTLVMQFGSAWYFISWVFLQEHLNHRSRPRLQCSQRWSFLQRTKLLPEAAIPPEAKFLFIPTKVLSARPSVFAGNGCTTFAGSGCVTSPKKEEKESPLAPLFSAIASRSVSSSLLQPSHVSDTVAMKLKERDAFFAADEADHMKRLQRMMRPDQPQLPYSKDPRRPAPAVRNIMQSQANLVANQQDLLKSSKSGIKVQAVSLQHPPNYLELRRQAIATLPVVRIFIDDESKFQHLLVPSRTPQQSIVVPYEQALAAAARIQEDLRRQSQSRMEQEIKNEAESVLSLSSQPMDALRDELLGDATSFALTEEMPEGKNELQDLCAEEPFSLMSMDLTEFLRVPEVQVSSIEEPQVALPPVRVEYPYLQSVQELEGESRGVKRPSFTPAEETVNLKRQRLPPSVERRMKQVQPTIVPRSFYHSVPQLVRSNVRRLQQNLNFIKDQKTPRVFPPSAAGVRKDPSQSGEVGAWRRVHSRRPSRTFLET